MKTIFKQNKNALEHHYTLTDPIWNELGSHFNRLPQIIFHHWELFMKPTILQYENKMEIGDIRRILIGYFVEKGIKFRCEINWGEVAKDIRFQGMTPVFLSNKLAQMVDKVKKANPEIEGRDITIKDLQQYLVERARKPRVDKRVRRLIEIYENIKTSM